MILQLEFKKYEFYERKYFWNRSVKGKQIIDLWRFSYLFNEWKVSPIISSISCSLKAD